MRVLALMRGAMGSGKSTWIKNNNLEQYTLSPDQIRLMFQTPVLTENGGTAISMKNDKQVWKFMFDLLEERMKRGEFTIIDATHSKARDVQQYKSLVQMYKYRVFVIDFTDIPIEVAKKQNKMRPEYKHVPEAAIDNVYSRFETQTPSNWAKTVKPEEFLDTVKYKVIDLSQWKKVHHIGDVHGCHDVLLEYFDGGLKDDELYIFVGDFVDRGIQNAEVMEFLFSIMDRDNVIFLEGNHEIHLYDYAKGNKIKSKEFFKYTMKQLDDAKINKKKIRMFYRKLRQVAYYTYHDKTIIVTHGGISTVPEFLFVSTQELIKGVGDYNTDIDKAFSENVKETNVYQIHGHRNIQDNPVYAAEKSFNLEGGVERGGCLRTVTLDENGFTTYEIKNKTYSERMKKIKKDVKIETNADFLDMLRNNDLIQEKEMGRGSNISSFNFKNKVFYDKLWDEQTVKARGLFVNTETNEILIRSYDKYFNINEREETKLQILKQNLTFPVDIYLKENGYLGLCGYDSSTDQLILASKSTTKGEFAEWFSDMFYDSVSEEKIRKIKDFLRDTNTTLVFEVIEPEKDPHIIKYNKRQLVLLDIVHRMVEYKKFGYIELLDTAEKLGFTAKTKTTQFSSWQDLYRWYERVSSDSSIKVEGYVLEDSDGFMTKIKLPYYNFWKSMRYLKEKLHTKQPNYSTAMLTTPLANEFHAFMKEKDQEELKQRDIISLREEFYDNKEG